MTKTQYTRKELYDLVWLEPLTTIANKLNVSYSGIRKICERMNIPIPAVGFWMKKQFGKPVVIIPLDENFKGENVVSLMPMPEGKPPIVTIDSPLKILQIAVEANQRIQLKIPEKLNKPDPLITQYKQNLITRKQKDNRYPNGYENHLNINVTSDQEKRALLIMDTLIKAIKSRGNEVKVVHRETIFFINGEKFTCSIREKNKRVKIENSKYSWNSWNLVPTGILVFKMEGYYGREWYDGKVPLENQLSRIIAKLEFDSEKRKVDREESRKRKEEYDRKRALEEEYRLKKQQEFAAFQNLLKDSQRWKKLIILREYLVHIENTMKENPKSSPYSIEWLQWANLKADWYDPAKNQFDELFSGVDRNSI